MAIALDAGFPVSAHPTFSAVFSTATSPSITTPGTNRLLVVVAQWAQNAPTTVPDAPLACSGAGLTWTKMQEVSSFLSGSFPTGALAIFYAYAPSVLTAQTITITRNSSDATAQSAVVTVYSLSGAASTQTGATAGHALAASSNLSDSISPAAGSWVIGGVGNTGTSGGTAMTAASGCSKDIEVLDTFSGDSYDTVSYQGAPGGAITVGFTGTDDSVYVALAEIQAAATATAAQFQTSITAKGTATASTLTFPGVLDFGDPGGNEAQLVITGQTGILAGSQVEAWIQAEDYGGLRTGLDMTYASQSIGLTCGSIVPGVGFTIYGRCLQKMQGRFKVRWFWV